MPDFSDKGVIARFADQLVGLSISKLLSNIATFHVLVSPGSQGEIFGVNGHGYQMRLWIKDQDVYFSRNKHIARRPINFPREHSHIAASWNMNTFQLAVYTDFEVSNDEVCQTVRTPEGIFVPNTLISWARKNHKLPRYSFNSPEEAISVILETMAQIQARIRDSNMFSLFWDYNRETVVSKSPRPKLENQSFGGLVGFLQDDSVLKGYTIVREGRASSGALDAHVIAPLNAGGTTVFALEAKNAHSKDLEHGLQQQLPEYMRAIDARYGIYVVLWYKCKCFDKPAEMQNDLSLRLMKLKPLSNMHVDFMDLSLPIAPSDRDFEYL